MFFTLKKLHYSFNVTIYGQASDEAYWQSDYVYSSSNLRLDGGNGSVFSDSSSSSISKTYTFTALEVGTASFSPRTPLKVIASATRIASLILVSTSD